MQTVSPRRDAATVRPAVRLNATGWQTLCDRHHLKTDAQKAAFLGVTRQAVNEFQNRRRTCSGEFIAIVLSRFVVPFEAVFTYEMPRKWKGVAA